MHAACVHVVCLHVHRWCVHACALCDACARVWSLSVPWRPQGGPQRPRGAGRGCRVQGRWTPVFWAGEVLARGRCPRSRCPRGWCSSRDPATGSAACPGGTSCPVTPLSPAFTPQWGGPRSTAVGKAGFGESWALLSAGGPRNHSLSEPQFPPPQKASRLAPWHTEGVSRGVLAEIPYKCSHYRLQQGPAGTCTPTGL